MPSKPFSALLTDPRFKGLPEEEQTGLVNKYWDNFSNTNPDNKDFAESQKQAGLATLTLGRRFRDATPAEKRVLEVPLRDAITSIGLNEDRLLGKVDDSTYKARFDEYKAQREAKVAASKDVASWYDPKVQESVNPLLTNMGKLAAEGDKFGTAGTLQKGADLLVRVATLGGTKPKAEAAANYDAFRQQIASQFKLSNDEVDNLVKHRMGVYEAPVSRDALGQVHIKDEVLAQPVAEIQKAVEQSALPDSIKTATINGLPERVTAFKAGVLANTMANHKELADALGFSKPPETPEQVDEMYASLSKELHDTLTGQFGGGVAAAMAGSYLTQMGRGAQMVEPGAYSAGQKEPLDPKLVEARQQSINLLSGQINKDKTSIFGTGADVIGQGVYSGAESLVVLAATSGLGTALMTPARSAALAARFGRLGELAAVGARAAGDIAPSHSSMAPSREPGPMRPRSRLGWAWVTL